MSAIPHAGSQGEAAFALHCQAEGVTPEREYIFSKRKFRFDFAFVPQKIAVEIEGGIWTAGRHSRGRGMEKDMCKYNLAAKLGWRILRYSTGMVLRGEAINDVLALL